ncbi:MAG: hypothetical protein UV61_C0022G0007 [Candidatus Gottesmanbacteria bacterium GW2011_GWB1_43_11]|uniref:Ribbon-helix-helix protein CopG domain-containing protein n=1 Tax=Candidatus Gottesmanbacteria bacterium GW2011_GWB1_43_11 TaxID=1618446 RepID=A0A0G1CHL1_9BACT|nr:MAG: hypothetical protein UV04_C0021G0007 [Candidatus Gottesmanbacteria bacterium GW2011_GWA2_42_16]KKS54000.1 MAG: hypothetical protein UV17_C0028G0008 [Candidatus Gottesmanbacteria bacterium GW2011_GWA1_42_26]KKS80644.1 MAG: hypothetical protein UV55_C0034G0007 [Candidatus Gottesmanbacteria bacterium GW2011_GWC1_43_10]KKS85002.1 MAG: hypothetical protein UV61_C0022G0007 [Candidatus Gottesmanbacteria bacterium GW2011_GWB1_43_11]OGG09460.1 MAG: hypothetical protein A2699_05670 [Candidatus Go
MDTQAFNIVLPKQLVKKTDQIAKKGFSSRSAVIRTALQQYIQDIESWNKIFAAGKKAGRKMGIRSEEDVNRIVYDFRHGGK